VRFVAEEDVHAEVKGEVDGQGESVVEPSEHGELVVDQEVQENRHAVRSVRNDAEEVYYLVEQRRQEPHEVAAF